MTLEQLPIRMSHTTSDLEPINFAEIPCNEKTHTKLSSPSPLAAFPVPSIFGCVSAHIPNVRKGIDFMNHISQDRRLTTRGRVSCNWMAVGSAHLHVTVSDQEC